MKLFIIIFCALFFAPSCFSDNGENKKSHEINGSSMLKTAGSYMVEKRWDDAKKILDVLDVKSVDVIVAWALWYGDISNPLHDKNRSIYFFEEAYKLGSREAQLFLIGVYLFSKDSESVNYNKGVSLGRDLMDYYLLQIQQGNDIDGEIHRNVGKFYLFGIGVDKNEKLATEYIKKSADLGDKEAIEMLKDN